MKKANRSSFWRQCCIFLCLKNNFVPKVPDGRRPVLAPLQVIGGAEIDWPDNDGPSKLRGMTLADQIAGVDIDGPQLKQYKLNKILLNALKTKQNTSQLANSAIQTYCHVKSDCASH